MRKYLSWGGGWSVVIPVRENAEDMGWSRVLRESEKELFWGHGKSLGTWLWGSLKRPRRRCGYFGGDHRRQGMQIHGKPELLIYPSFGSVWSILMCYRSLEITFMKSKAFSRKDSKLSLVWHFNVLEMGLISKARPKCITTLIESLGLDITFNQMARTAVLYPITVHCSSQTIHMAGLICKPESL